MIRYYFLVSCCFINLFSTFIFTSDTCKTPQSMGKNEQNFLIKLYRYSPYIQKNCEQKRTKEINTKDLTREKLLEIIKAVLNTEYLQNRISKKIARLFVYLVRNNDTKEKILKRIRKLNLTDICKLMLFWNHLKIHHENSLTSDYPLSEACARKVPYKLTRKDFPEKNLLFKVIEEFNNPTFQEGPIIIYNNQIVPSPFLVESILAESMWINVFVEQTLKEQIISFILLWEYEKIPKKEKNLKKNAFWKFRKTYWKILLSNLQKSIQSKDIEKLKEYKKSLDPFFDKFFNKEKSFPFLYNFLKTNIHLLSKL